MRWRLQFSIAMMLAKRPGFALVTRCKSHTWSRPERCPSTASWRRWAIKFIFLQGWLLHWYWQPEGLTKVSAEWWTAVSVSILPWSRFATKSQCPYDWPSGHPKDPKTHSAKILLDRKLQRGVPRVGRVCFTGEFTFLQYTQASIR